MNDKNITRLIVGPIATNCWIYPLNNGEAAIIDPGDEADVIISALNKLSLVPRYILLSHGHFDHICAVPQIIAQMRTACANSAGKVEIGIHPLDAEYLGPEAYKAHERSIKAAMGSTLFIDAFWNDMPSADILLEEGSVIGPFTTLHVPGHTQGSLAFWDKEARVLFTGDTLFAGGYGRTDLPGGNENALLKSLNRLCAMDGDIVVYPGHGEITTIKREAGI